jgi:hypothetical protein
MLATVNRKKEIYDKRPEDHPRYGEEWRQFWEQRFRDLKAEGVDTDSHDFKADWIPHWAARVETLFQQEVGREQSLWSWLN